MHPLAGSPVLKAIKSLLRPLVRLCVRHAIKAVEVEELLKLLFVEEARSALREQGQEESVSRLSIITGLQRPLVSTLLKDSPGEPDSSDLRASLLMKVVGAWQTLPEYTTADGQARVLACEGKQSEFAGLVRSISQSLNPYTVLFELERSGMVERAPRGLRLLRGTLIHQSDKTQGLQFLSLDIRDLVEAVNENLFSSEAEKQLNHHVTTEFDNLSDEAAIKARRLLLEEGHRVHKRLRKLLGSLDRDIGHTATGQGRKRIVFTSFSRVHDFINEKPAC